MPRAGPAELAARRDLRALPKVYADSAVGKVYLNLARRIDSGASDRDATSLARELRLCLLALYALAPPKPVGDFTDEMQARREQRMKAQGQ